MAPATYEDVLEAAQRLAPADQQRLLAALAEELEAQDAARAYDAAKAAGGDGLPLDAAIAEIERERAALRQAG